MRTLRAIGAAIAAALAALPRLVWTVVVEGGRSVLRLVSRRPDPMPPSAADTADELADHLADVRREHESATRHIVGKTVIKYASARLAGVAGPDIVSLPFATRTWLKSLQDQDFRIIVRHAAPHIERHLAARVPAEQIPVLLTIHGTRRPAITDDTPASTGRRSGVRPRPQVDPAAARILDELLVEGV